MILAAACAVIVPAHGAPAAERYSVRMQKEGGVSFVVLTDVAAGVEAAIAPAKGGELSSLRVQRAGAWLELLYRARDYGDGRGWRGKAPILWPAVGRNFSRSQPPDPKAEACSYDMADLRFDIPIHGFARFQEWTVVQQGADARGAHVELELRDNAGTRRQYPFGFRFRLTYRMAEGRLSLDHEVTAAEGNRSRMFFSIGNHLTFGVPLVPGSSVEQMTVSTPSQVEFIKDANTLPTGEKKSRTMAEPVRLSDLEFMPPIGLGEYAGPASVVLRDLAGIAVSVKHAAASYPRTPFIQFNLWGSPRNGYFSPEPWIGMINSLNRRVGLIELDPGAAWTWRIEIAVEQF